MIAVNRAFFVLLFVVFALPAFADSTYLKFGATWKYLDNGIDPGASWKETNSPITTGWASGSAKFGYGIGEERTLIGGKTPSAPKPVTTYFRTSVNINNPSAFALFKLRLYLDDGMIVYVNGREVIRWNLANGPVTAGTYALQPENDNGNSLQSFDLPADKFTNGTNLVAVEVHQFQDETPDMAFDLSITGISSNTSPVIMRGPFLQQITNEGVLISWKTSQPSSSRVNVGTSENNLSTFVSNEVVSTDHQLRIKGLMADTKYFYSVGSVTETQEASYRNFFVTSPPADTKRKIRIGVFGDAGIGDYRQKGTRDSYLRLLKKDAPAELALMLGDNAYHSGTEQEYQSNFFDIYDDNMFKNHVVFPIPGNHEYAAPGVPYFSIFSLPTAGESGGLPSGTESYYSFDYGNIHFVMLNSMGSDGNKKLSDSTGEQALWLKKDLEANRGKHKWTIAALHHPPYSNGTHNSDGESDLTAIRQQLTPILERYGVDAVLSGHSHVYERSFLIQGHTGSSSTFKAVSSPTGNLVSSSSGKYDGSVNSCPYFTNDTVTKKGTVYVVAGSAGLIGGGTNEDMPLFYYKNYSGTSGGENGVLYLEVEDNRLDAKFVGLSGIIRDQFTIMKGVNNKRVITVEINKPVMLTASWIGSYNWLPASPAGREGPRSITVRPEQLITYNYYVRDSAGPSNTCITDSFEVHVTAAAPPADIAFEALQKNKKILLKWQGGTESTGDYYTIEKSGTGQHYNFLTIIPALVANSSSTRPSYEFEDNYPLTGNNYYRLVKQSKTGQTLMSGIRVLKFETKMAFTYQVKTHSGNKDFLTLGIENNRRQPLQVSIFDLTGNKVYAKTITASEASAEVQVALPGGIYILNILAQDKTYMSEKILVR